MPHFVEDRMYFLPALSCMNCSHPIWLPPPIQGETFPSQTPWRWDDRPLNVACLSCNQAFEYWDGECHWSQLETHQMEMTREMAAHQLSVPCGETPCAGRIYILV